MFPRRGTTATSLTAPHGRFDPTGYVKGWAVERAAARLTEAGPASHLVNAPVALVRSAAFSAIMIAGALVLPLVMTGITGASATRIPYRPRAFSSGSA